MHQEGSEGLANPFLDQEASHVLVLQLLLAQFLCFAAQIGSPTPNASKFCSSIKILVENSEEVKNILEEIQPHAPVTLQ